MFKAIRSFYSWPLELQWSFSIFGSLAAIAALSFIFMQLFFPLNIVFIPFIKSIAHFSIAPLLRLSGLLNYHSPFMLTVKFGDNKWEIHNGTTFDYLLNMRWTYKGEKAKQMILQDYLLGLLNIIEEIKRSENPKAIEIMGTSYFIGKNTISRIGFSEVKVSPIKRILFFIDYVNLLIFYSFSKGKISFPNVLKLRKVKIRGDQLIKAEKLINSYKIRFDQLTLFQQT
jgi:hypothetical protein